MIALRIGTEFLDLQDAKIRVRMDSPFFNADIIAPAFTYPFSLPRTPTNTRLLGHADRISRTDKAPTTACTVYIGGVPWRTGILHFRGIKSGKFDLDLAISRNIPIERFADRRIRSFDLGTIEWIGPSSLTMAELKTLLDTYVATEATVPFVLAPYRNTRVLGDRPEWYRDTEDIPAYAAPTGWVNQYGGSDADWPWTHFTPGSTDPDPQWWIHPITPFPYMARAVESIFDQLGYILTGDVLANEEVRTLVIANNLHKGFQLDSNAALEEDADINPDGHDEIELADALPDMSIIELLLALQKRFNARFIFDQGNTVRFMSMAHVLRAGVKRDITALVDPEPEFTVDGETEPEFTSAEEPLEETERAEAAYPEEDLLATVDGYSDLAALTPAAGDVARVRATDELFIYGFDQITATNTWVRKQAALPAEVTAAERTTVDLGVVLTEMETVERPEDGAEHLIVPRIDMPLSDVDTDYHGMGRKDLTKLRLLFFRGMQPYSAGGDTYPLLTNGDRDATGARLSGCVMTERIDGPGGIHETWYSHALDVLNAARTRKTRVRFGPEIIHAYAWDELLHERGTDYLAKSIDVEFTATRMGVPTVELVRVTGGTRRNQHYCAGGLRVTNAGLASANGIYCPHPTDPTCYTKVGGTHYADSIYHEPLVGYTILTSGGTYADDVLNAYYGTDDVPIITAVDVWFPFVGYGPGGPLPVPTVEYLV